MEDMTTASHVDETTLRVRYAETDAMGVVHHSQYIIWFEVGRSSFMRNARVSYAEIERAGHQFRIAEVGARYHAPACYDQVITVRTWLSELHSRGLTFSYAIVRPGIAGGAGQVLVTGFTKLICTDRAGQVHRLPAELRQALQPLAAPARGPAVAHACGSPGGLPEWA
jgi:acyl-CoA thioester hydrolase